MKINIDGADVFVIFKHTEKGTSCQVRLGDTEVEPTGNDLGKDEGKSVLHKGDQFCRERGRVLSLYRALARGNSSFTTLIRSQIRYEYFKRTRNSISSVAQSLYSNKQLHGKNTNEQQELIFQKGINWNDYPTKYKRGRIIKKEIYEKESEGNDGFQTSIRARWISVEEIPIFTQDRDFLSSLIPIYE